MGFFRDVARAFREDSSLGNARARNRIDDYNKKPHKRPRSLMDGMGTPYGRFDQVRYDDDDE
jgi:hypothetical protein